MVGSLAALAVTAAWSQQDLDAGKTGPQLFAQDCAACHRSPQGLAKTVSGSGLVSFLRQHYTSSSTSASAVAAYVQAAGPAPRNERQKDQGRAGAAPRTAAPAVPPAGRPTAPIPSAHPPAAQPAASPPAEGPQPTAQQPAAGAKQRERLARPGNPAAEPGAVDQRGRPLRKSRRVLHEQQQQSTSPTAESGAALVPAAPEPQAPAATAATGPGGQAATAKPGATGKPGFSEPLP